MYPTQTFTDNWSRMMRILRIWAPVAVICNTVTHEELKRFNVYLTGDDMKFYQLTSGLSSNKRTKKIAEILASIRNLKINNLLTYIDQEDLKEVLTLGEMMQMTGLGYNWIIPWRNIPIKTTLPINTFIVKLKNQSSGFQNILSDAIDLIKQGFVSYTHKYTMNTIPQVRCLDIVDSTFGEEFYRFIIL